MIGNEVSAAEAITVTIFSMGLVFLVLFAINLILDGFKMQSEREQKALAKKAAKDQPVQKEQPVPAKPQEDESEIIAVITAALVANLKTSKDKLIIKSIRQIQDPTWAQTGRIENMN
jgi:sodium pump decarboxylase gamma subunit